MFPDISCQHLLAAASGLQDSEASDQLVSQATHVLLETPAITYLTCKRRSTDSDGYFLRLSHTWLPFQAILSPPTPLMWDKLVYATLQRSEGIYVFSKGLPRRLDNVSEVSCIYESTLQRAVISAAQEVVLCPHIPGQAFDYCNTTVTLAHRGSVLPTVAQPTCSQKLENLHKQTLSIPKAFLCACTMVYNSADMLEEWVSHHVFLGVERFFILDNNSEDNLQAELIRLTRTLNVGKGKCSSASSHSDRQSKSNTHHSTNGATQDLTSGNIKAPVDLRWLPWPWPKTQEAGFSFCAALARQHCHWMLFLDLDEYILVAALMPQRNSSNHSKKPQIARIKALAEQLPPLHALILGHTGPGMVSPRVAERTSGNQSDSRQGGILLKGPVPVPHAPGQSCAQPGQISLSCFTFGPSGNSRHPKAGFVSGYNCRMRAPERVKSFVLLDALAPPLHNEIHRFTSFKTGYCTTRVREDVSAVFHYKYPAWPVFARKFSQRASTYVADWAESKGLGSQDRTPGLGTEAVEPSDWKDRFCEVRDSRLKRYKEMMMAAGQRVGGNASESW